MELNKKVKCNPITPKQKEILVEFISAGREMYTGKLTPMYTREKMVRNWMELTNILNSIPDGPAKDWKQWRKSWVDIKKNTKSRYAGQKKYMVGTGGGPPSFFPPADLPGIEEKVLNIITPVAISGNNNIPETEVLFDFETETSHDFVNLSITNSTLERENIPEQTNTSNVDIKSNGHNDCLTQPIEIVENCTVVYADNSRNSNGDTIPKKRMTKTGRLQQSLKNNKTFLKFSEDSINFDREHKQKKLLLLENDFSERRKYYERKAGNYGQCTQADCNGHSNHKKYD